MSPRQRAEIIDPRRDADAARAWDIKLGHLRAFTQVAAAGSVTRAAKALFRVASAVTRSIRELERDLGTPLFERKARGMLLNVYGEAVRRRAARIDEQITEACRDMADAGSLITPQTLSGSMFNGRRLAAFASLAELHNMPVVARAFGITQPTISASVKELEDRVGVALFERSARGVMPTQAGAALAFRFRRVLAELRNIGADITAIKGTLTGSVTIGALPLGRTLVLPLAIASLVGRHPMIRVSTVEGPYDVLAASLSSGDIDLILGALRPPHATKGFVQEALFDDRVSVIVRAGHPLVRKKRIGFHDLHRAKWVLARSGAPARNLLELSFRESGQPPPLPAVETSDLAILRGLLLHSDMVTAISAHQLHFEIRAGALVVLPFPLDKTDRQIGVTYRSGALLSPGVLALLEAIRSVVRKHIPG